MTEKMDDGRTQSMVNMYGRKAVESTEVLFLMDGQDERWLYWRGKFARDILNCIKQGS